MSWEEAFARLSVRARRALGAFAGPPDDALLQLESVFAQVGWPMLAAAKEFETTVAGLSFGPLRLGIAATCRAHPDEMKVARFLLNSVTQRPAPLAQVCWPAGIDTYNGATEMLFLDEYGNLLGDAELERERWLAPDLATYLERRVFEEQLPSGGGAHVCGVHVGAALAQELGATAVPEATSDFLHAWEREAPRYAVLDYLGDDVRAGTHVWAGDARSLAEASRALHRLAPGAPIIEFLATGPSPET